MSQFEESATVIDWFKDRLASPFLFSYSLIVLAYNWQFIGWVLYHPMKFGDKIKSINGGFAPVELDLLYPFGLTLLILILSPIFNDIGSFFIKLSNRLFSSLLNHLDWDEYVKAKKFYNLETEKQSLESNALALKGENINLSKAVENSRIESEKLKLQVKELESSVAEKTKNYSDLAESNNKLQKSYSQASSEINQLMEKLKSCEVKLSNQTYHADLRHSKKVLQLHQFSNDPLNQSLSDTIKEKLEKQKIQAEYFVDNFDQVLDHPIFGIVIGNCFYKMGDMVLISDDLDMREGVRVTLILNGRYAGTDIFISFPDSSQKVFLEEDYFIVPKIEEAFYFVKIECRMRQSPLTTEVVISGEIDNFKQPLLS